MTPAEREAVEALARVFEQTGRCLKDNLQGAQWIHVSAIGCLNSLGGGELDSADVVALCRSFDAELVKIRAGRGGLPG